MSARQAAALMIVAAVLCGELLMSSMMLHMFVQLPLFFVGGFLLTPSEEFSATASPWPAFPVMAGFVFATGVLMTWMIPRALDAAVETNIVNALKAVSLVLAGQQTARSWQRASPIVRTFVAGNTLWMTGTAGMLYLEAPSRLCTSYARSEQQQVGITLIAITVLGVIAGLSRLSSRQISDDMA